jgi:dTMP kinase
VSTIAEEVAALRGTKPATLKDLLRNPAFSKLAAAMTVSSLGDWVGFIAVSALVVRLGGRNAPYAVAGVMIARTLPSVLFGPLAGVIVDRVDRKKLMMTADIARGVLYGSMPFIGRLWGIFALSFVIECLSLVWSPAKDATLPNLISRRQLVNANSVGVAASYGTLPLGGIIFTALAAGSIALGHGIPYFEHRPEFLALWLDAGTFAFSATMVSRLPIRPAPRRHTQFRLSQAGADIVDGVRFLRSHGLARALTTGIVIAFIGIGSVLSIGPVFAQFSLGAGPQGWGLLVTALGIGMAVGMASVGFVAKLVEREVLFPLAVLAGACGLLVVAAMPNIGLAGLVTGVMGIAVGVAWVSGYSLLQENVADEYRGRTFGTLNTMSRLGLFLSLAGFPFLVGVVGKASNLALASRVGMWAGGGVVVLAGVFSRRGMKRHRLTKPEPLTLMPRLKKGQRRGVFVAFEGVEGSGKGTQIRLAREYLESEGFDVLVTREPGGTDLGEKLREMLLDPETGTVEPRTEALLFAASRSQHVATVIRPALEQGQIVLCDRYVDSSLAYQGVARGLGEQDVLTLNVWATQGLFPDLVVLFHLEPEIGLGRSPEDPDRIEREGAEFHAKVADAYLKIAEEHPERFVTVDSSRPPDLVHVEVRQALERLVRGREDSGEKPPEEDSVTHPPHGAPT